MRPASLVENRAGLFQAPHGASQLLRQVPSSRAFFPGELTTEGVYRMTLLARPFSTLPSEGELGLEEVIFCGLA